MANVRVTEISGYPEVMAFTKVFSKSYFHYDIIKSDAFEELKSSNNYIHIDYQSNLYHCIGRYKDGFSIT